MTKLTHIQDSLGQILDILSIHNTCLDQGLRVEFHHGGMRSNKTIL